MREEINQEYSKRASSGIVDALEHLVSDAGVLHEHTHGVDLASRCEIVNIAPHSLGDLVVRKAFGCVLKDITIAAVVAIALGLNAQSAAAEEIYSGAFRDDFPSNVYWGDTHVHTSLSSGDANRIGGNTAPPTIAYRFARGETVDVADASYTNSIGDPELAVVWIDPGFNSDQLAFYYVRVLEIPTPRWTAYDAKFNGLNDLPEEITMVTQDRAYTPPIWYTPM